MKFQHDSANFGFNCIFLLRTYCMVLRRIHSQSTKYELINVLSVSLLVEYVHNRRASTKLKISSKIKSKMILDAGEHSWKN